VKSKKITEKNYLASFQNAVYVYATTVPYNHLSMHCTNTLI